LVDTGPRPEVENPPPADSSKADEKKANVAKPDAGQGDRIPPPDKAKAGDENPKNDTPKKADESLNDGKTSAASDANDAAKAESK
jgi:hypothetical protein